MGEPTPRTSPRTTRAGWAKSEGIALTERDARILYSVGRCKVLRTRDLARLFFGQRATANDRLRKLFCAGLLRCEAPALAGDNYYTLTERGRDVVVERLGVETSALIVPRELPRRLEHLVLLNETRIHFTLAVRRHPDVALIAFRPEWQLASERSTALMQLVPDALMALRIGERVLDLAVEVDAGTESPSYVARRKVALYDAHIRAARPIYGAAVERVLLIARGKRRLQLLARALVDARATEHVRLADALTLDEDTCVNGGFARAESLVSRDSPRGGNPFGGTELAPAVRYESRNELPPKSG